MPPTFVFPPTVLAQHLAILGRTGSGKSYTAKGAVESPLNDKRRVCILDPTGIWYGLRSSADGKRAGFPVVVFGGPHADVAINEHSGPALASVIAAQNLPAIVDLSEMLIGQRHRFVTDFAASLYTENRLPLHLVIDEADEFCPQNPMPETKRMLHHIDRIVRRGRVRGFRVMLITQRPAVLNKKLTQANALIAMRLTGPQDRAAMKAWIDGQGDPVAGKEVLDSLAQLKIGEGWVWAPEVSTLERVQFPRITTFDSGRTPDDDAPVAAPTKLAQVDISAITASFAAIEKEASTVVELQAELAKLRKLHPGAAVGQTGHTDAQVQALIAAERAASKRELEKLTVPLAQIRDLVMEALGQGFDTMAREAAPAAPVATAPTARKAAVPAGAKAAGVAAAGVTRPQQAILNAIAQLNAFGVDHPAKPMIGAHAGASPRSSGFTNNLSSLRTAGLVDYPEGGLVALTEAGRAKAQAVVKKPTLSELHESWLALSSLRTLGLLDYPQAGYVVATTLLFPKGTR